MGTVSAYLPATGSRQCGRDVLDKDGNETGRYEWNGRVANKALELLGREIGMFVERHEVTLAQRLADMPEDRQFCRAVDVAPGMCPYRLKVSRLLRRDMELGSILAWQECPDLLQKPREGGLIFKNQVVGAR
jgi:hypothetical protein